MNLSRKPAYWLFLMLLVAGVMIVAVEQLAYVGGYPGAWLLSVLLLALTAIPAGLIIYRMDQFEPEPASLIAVALLWGGVVALTFSAMSNSALLTFLQNILPGGLVESWGPSLVAPLNEEFYKGAGLVIIYLMSRQEIDGLMDGLVYGAMIGLGFQVVENVQYFMLAAAETAGGQLGAVAELFFVRVVLAGLYSHMLFTGLLGFGFAYFVTRKSVVSRGKRLMVFAAFIALSWGAHFVWNSPWLDDWMSASGASFALALVVKGLPFLVLLVLLGVLAARRERQAFTRLMAEEVGGDAVSAEEFAVLSSGRKRRRALREIKRRKGPNARYLLKRLQREQMNLALFHDKVGSAGHPAIQAQRDLIVDLKGRLAAVG